MKVLITGSCGFVGPYVAALFSERSDEVHGLDRSSCEGVVSHQADLTDAKAVSRVISEVRPELIIHLAAQSSVSRSWEQPELTEQVNVGGTKNLLQAVVDAGIRPRILLISSVEIYGEQQSQPIPESAAPNPQSPYAHSRVAQEALVKEFDLPIIIVRPFTHTGPGQQTNFVVPSFAKQVADAAAGRCDVIRFGNLSVRRDISDVRDVARAYVLLAEKGVPGEIYNVCSGTAYALQEILDMLLELAPQAKSAKLEQDTSRVRKRDIDLLQGDNAKLRALGWEPQIPLRKTLQDMLQ